MPATMAVAERRSRRVNLSLVLAIAASMLACNIALANAYVCEEDMSFGLELEYAGQGDMKVMHINQMPASNYERLMRVIASSFGVDEPQTEQIVDFVPHPTMPEKFEPRRVRTIYWTDPKERRWKITAEYVAKGGVYDGYEVVSPPMRSADEVEGVVRNIIASGLVEEGLKSGSHVHINASCLVHADGSARGLVNLFLLYESNEPSFAVFSARSISAVRKTCSRRPSTSPFPMSSRMSPRSHPRTGQLRVSQASLIRSVRKKLSILVSRVAKSSALPT
eukprot:Opistho-2@92412